MSLRHCITNSIRKTWMRLGMWAVFVRLGPAFVAILRVPDDYAWIQDALKVAREGDEIVVASDRCQENLLFTGKNVILHSENPRDPRTVERPSQKRAAPYLW